MLQEQLHKCFYLVPYISLSKPTEVKRVKPEPANNLGRQSPKIVSGLLHRIWDSFLTGKGQDQEKRPTIFQPAEVWERRNPERTRPPREGGNSLFLPITSARLITPGCFLISAFRNRGLQEGHLSPWSRLFSRVPKPRDAVEAADLQSAVTDGALLECKTIPCFSARICTSVTDANPGGWHWCAMPTPQAEEWWRFHWEVNEHPLTWCSWGSVHFSMQVWAQQSMESDKLEWAQLWATKAVGTMFV